MIRLFRTFVLTCLIASVWGSVGYAQSDNPNDPTQTVKVLVVYHSLTGNTEKMAKAVVQGAQSVPATMVELQRVGEVTAEQLFGSDGLIVGSPVYWSNMAGEVKTFFDNWQFKFGVLSGI